MEVQLELHLPFIWLHLWSCPNCS